LKSALGWLFWGGCN